jgi:alkylation response protein AidB-like acyl-CoA dehydrogenase
VFEVLGDLCLPTSYLETSVIAAGLLIRSRGEDSDTLLRKIANGARVAVAGCDPAPLGNIRAELVQGQWNLNGSELIVLDALDVDDVVVVASDSEGKLRLFWAHLDAEGVAKRAVPTLDGRMASDLAFNGAGARLLANEIVDAVQEVSDEAAACVCIEASAMMARLVRDTTAYVKQREQFGQPLSAFQVVQHRLVDMHIQARRAGAIARRAVVALAEEQRQRERAVSAAKVTICRAGRFVGQNAVQLHGGMGMTADLAVSRYFKRLTVIEGQLGGADYHLRRFQQLREGAS